MSDNVKVAVRVRPFNNREKEKNSVCIISMHEKTTTIRNPESNEEKSFAFDYSYWSHNPSDPNFATQAIVFNDLGIGVLENAWKGYNVSLFAYGQTGSGKSYSMVGYGVDKGIIPCACQELFRRISENPDSTVTFKGPYVDGLALLPVKDLAYIEQLMDEGTRARTVASTQMNATSSRAHTIFTIILTQTTTNMTTMKVMDKVSKINLVDLAGSERAASTGATGDRLKEGAAINKSLSALGNVISALADASEKKGKQVFVPYRDSILTWLLKESLGGNSRTIMIAALSPADINYEETLSTLRPNQKLIRELQEEVERLRKLAEKSTPSEVELESLTAAARKEAEEAAREKSKLEEELAESKKLLEELNKSWDEKIKDAEAMESDRKRIMEEMGIAVSEDELSMPQLVNINEDPMKSGAVIYALRGGTTTVGRPDADVPQTIKFVGLNMSKEHCRIINDGGAVSIVKVGNSRTWINGIMLDSDSPQLLKQNDRIRFGNNHLFRFNNPLEAAEHERLRQQAISRGETPPEAPVIDWEFAQHELAIAAGHSDVLVESEQELKMAEEMKKKIEEAETRLQQEREEVQKKLEEQQLIIQKKDEEMKSLVGKEKEEAQKKFEAEERALLERQKQLEEQLRHREEEAEQLRAQQSKKRRENELLHDRIVSMLPLIHEANMISEELDKGCKFELKIVQRNVMETRQRMRRNSIGSLQNENTIAVRVVDTLTEKNRLWSREKFMDRIYSMRDYYHREIHLLDSEEEDSKKEDPFRDVDDDVVLGHAHVYLESLYWLIPIELTTPIIDYKGKSEGEISVKIEVLNEQGKTFEVEDGVPAENIRDIWMSNAVLQVEILSARGLPDHLHNYLVVYIDFNEQEHYTERCNERTSQPIFNHKRRFPVVLNEEFEQTLLAEAISFQIQGVESFNPNHATRKGNFRASHAEIAEMNQKNEKKQRELEEKEARLKELEENLLRPITSASASSEIKKEGWSSDILIIEEEDDDDLNMRQYEAGTASNTKPETAEKLAEAEKFRQELEAARLEKQRIEEERKIEAKRLQDEANKLKQEKERLERELKTMKDGSSSQNIKEDIEKEIQNRLQLERQKLQKQMEEEAKKLQEERDRLLNEKTLQQEPKTAPARSDDEINKILEEKARMEEELRKVREEQKDASEKMKQLESGNKKSKACNIS
ncbi:hypothetical protein GUITHDRAFT_109518 [Guillardia theta CCMP2712]|uniref:Kinesin motor domain-containing protein n=1 Tax=Guillardia theta (strain CCMP2712) TaxID=905079 RepID=L1J876_GUITC|nr:hypothetical protein GUITHDRAFT_109518 [Guillardia theta CCMP2712]EKX44741.1 hypothetical protein GUITHDRAFT_109518 [Guillardia theta CCMP2712]|eukprot:XP_005831721.1 hypothetical protein GUITHDRAFT_109518 [Guillardia theta CCMP2712]